MAWSKPEVKDISAGRSRTEKMLDDTTRVMGERRFSNREKAGEMDKVRDRFKREAGNGSTKR